MNDAIESQDIYVITIGASAGGLEAIHEFFDHLKGKPEAAFIIIQHLSPDYKSMLAELVGKHTNMQVYEAENNMPLKKNCVYVIPPKKVMTIKQGNLCLMEKGLERGPNTAIDQFLFSLAKERGEKAIAIILSGTGTDGTNGIEAIKKAGGLVMVQDPLTAKFDGMPNSALTTDFVDFVLPPKLMPDELNQYLDEIKKNGHNRFDETSLQEIFKLLVKHCQHDFTNYKRPTLLRRLSRRMEQNGIKDVSEYLEFLNNHPEECSLLSRDFLIGVTKFFRDKAAFDILYNDVFPELIGNKNDGDTLKVWVTACSTGEEAYSLAILIDQYLKKQGRNINVKIFASDIDSHAIAYASKGSYPLSAGKDMSSEIVESYFTKQGRKIIVNQEIRKQIVFTKHNLIKDPPFIKNDLVTCRNMLIYLNGALQKKILTTLNFSVNPGGYLFFGPSENVNLVKADLEEVNGKWKIYRKLGKEKVSVKEAMHRNSEYDPVEKRVKTPSVYNSKKMASEASLAEDLKQLITAHYGFAAFYLNPNYEIKEAIGDFRRYLSLPDKIGSLNILKMLLPDLSHALGMALRRAIKENSEVAMQRIKVEDNSKIRFINLLVKCEDNNLDPSYITVVLSEGKTETKKKQLSKVRTPFDNSYVIQLENELNETKNNLQIAIENLETANEELQSSNEELLSANEELQSSNEELQSLNEELHTLNSEYQLKIKELVELNDDLNNYFRSTDIGQIFVDSKQRIRKFNPAAKKNINLIETDIGRPINHISTNIKQKDILADIQSVIKNVRGKEKEIEMMDGKSNLMRILPYLRQDGTVDGVVISFVDISAINDLNNIIRGVFNSSSSAIMAFKSVRNISQQITDLEFIASNYAAENLVHHTTAHLLGKHFKEVFPIHLKEKMLEPFVEVVYTGTSLHTEYSDGKLWYEVIAVKMMDGLVTTFTDITEKKRAEESIRKNVSELIATRNELKKLNEELESKIALRTKALSESETRFRLVSKATNDAIWDWNFIDNTIWLSDSFYAMFGYKKEADIVSRSYWLEKIHPDDLARVKQGINESINNNQHQWSEEYLFRKSDGSYAQVLDRGYILSDEYNTPYRMLASMFDVTALRTAEEKVATTIEEKSLLAESVPLIVWSADPQGNLTFLNNQFADYTGWKVTDGYGKKLKELIHPHDFEKLKMAFLGAARQAESFTVEVRIKDNAGNYRWNSIRGMVKKGKGGKIESWVGSCTDIHEHKVAADILEQKVKERTKELKESNENLEQSNIELQQFTSVASHDLKEPLRKIQTFGNLIIDRHASSLSKNVEEYVLKINKSSKRMSVLIDDLLNFSKLSQNQVFVPVNINKIIDEVISDLEFIIHDKKAVITVGPIPQLEVSPGQIRQLFQNLLSNALKFSKKEVAPVITIEAAIVSQKGVEAPKSENGSYCRITVADNGIGFNQIYAEKIFTIFQRLNGKTEYEGTGIGLAIVKKIIEKHNGLIAAHSEEGRGAVFTVVLPVQQS